MAILALMTLPSVLAASATGLLTADGEVRFAAHTSLQASPLGVLGGDAEDLVLFDIEASRVRVDIFEQRLITADLGVEEVRLAPADPTTETLVLDDARIRLVDTRGGWFGWYPDPDAQVRLESERMMVLQARSSATLATMQSSDPDRPGESFYSTEIHGEHLLLGSKGRLDALGGGAWKIKGGDFAIESRGQDRIVKTGDFQVAPYEMVVRWIYIAFDDGIVRIDTGNGSLAAAVLDADFLWQGDLVADAAEGEIRSPGARYTASGGTALVSGSFSSRAYPVSAPGGPRAVVTLDGDMQGASLPSAPAPAGLATRTAVPPWPAWVLVAFAVAGAAFAAGVLVWRARFRSRTRSFSADDCAAFAWRAAEEEDWVAAAAWIERARKLAPGSDRLWKDEGFFHEELGHHDEALERYVHAVRLRPDAFTCVRIARLHVTLGHPEDDVEAWLDRACDLDAAALDDIAEEEAFAPLLRLPRFARFARPTRDRGSAGFS